MALTSYQTRNPHHSATLRLPPEIIQRIAYRSPYRLACKFRLTCSWLHEWCKEADLRQYLLGRRRTYIRAAYKGRVDVLQRIDEDDKGEFWYCGGEFGREEVALGLGIVMRHKNVVDYALAKFPKPLPDWQPYRPTLKYVTYAEPDVRRALSLYEFDNTVQAPFFAAVASNDVSIFQTLLDHGIPNNQQTHPLGFVDDSIYFGSVDICMYLLNQHPALASSALEIAIEHGKDDILQAIIDSDLISPNLPASGIHAFQNALEHAVRLDSTVFIDLFLRDSNRECNPQLRTGKGRAMCLAVACNRTHLCSKLAECDDDIYNALSAAVKHEDTTLVLEKLIGWVAEENQNFRRSNFYVLPIVRLVQFV
ncbi:hypothetical protein HK097_009855 [Rhizophlyctis rosea]|uniref:Uncharacterized protein n=1 Tax=Rhizophlyctis rosea TaxID=64517 RepID=A0AAD5X0U1_9FUNG|nr:hypothetical protein HK097_009855 [Rhizophlyctis rosea]